MDINAILSPQIVKKVDLEAQRGPRQNQRRKRNPIDDLRREVSIMRTLRHKNIVSLQVSAVHPAGEPAGKLTPLPGPTTQASGAFIPELQSYNTLLHTQKIDPGFPVVLEVFLKLSSQGVIIHDDEGVFTNLGHGCQYFGSHWGLCLPGGGGRPVGQQDAAGDGLHGGGAGHDQGGPGKGALHPGVPCLPVLPRHVQGGATPHSRAICPILGQGCFCFNSHDNIITGLEHYMQPAPNFDADTSTDPNEPELVVAVEGHGALFRGFEHCQWHRL